MYVFVCVWHRQEPEKIFYLFSSCLYASFGFLVLHLVYSLYWYKRPRYFHVDYFSSSSLSFDPFKLRMPHVPRLLFKCNLYLSMAALPYLSSLLFSVTHITHTPLWWSYEFFTVTAWPLPLVHIAFHVEARFSSSIYSRLFRVHHPHHHKISTACFFSNSPWSLSVSVYELTGM